MIVDRAKKRHSYLGMVVCIGLAAILAYVNVGGRPLSMDISGQMLHERYCWGWPLTWLALHISRAFPPLPAEEPVIRIVYLSWPRVIVDAATILTMVASSWIVMHRLFRNRRYSR